MNTINQEEILIIDDHELVRNCLRRILEFIRPDALIHETSCSKEAYLVASRRQNISCVLLDLSLPDMNGDKLLPELKKILPNTKFIIITASTEPATLSKIKKLEPDAVITKSSDLQFIKNEISEVLVSTQVQSYNLSNRQKEILKLLERGLSNKKISEELFLAEGTVKNYISNILITLEVKNRTQAVNKARKMLLL